MAGIKKGTEARTASQSEARWWNPLQRGTIAGYAARVGIVGVMLTIVGEQLIDHSRATVDSVVDSKTELIRRDIQQPMAEAKQNVDKAVGSIKSMERDLGTVRQWFEDELGVKFDTAVPEARD